MIILALSIILFLLMSAIADERGIRAFFAIIGNIVLLVISLYLFAGRYNIYVITFVCGILFLVITLFAQNGVNVKTISSMISIAAVMLILVVIGYIVVNRYALGGFGELYTFDEDIAFLKNRIGVNANDLFTSACILGGIGAICDTALSVATVEYEVFNNNKDLPIAKLIEAGNNVGKDILGTTINTLLFAQFGDSFCIWILFIRRKYDIEGILNSKSFMQAMLMVVISSIGCLAIIPLTSVVMANILNFVKKSNKYGNLKQKN